MNIQKRIARLQWLRKSIIGRNKIISTPYGKRPLLYADFTASGRAVDFIEEYLCYLMQFYANTHTKDDFTGKTMTERLHQAEMKIKDLVNAGEQGRIIFAGTGATGGVARLQQILGVYWSPSTRNRLMEFIDQCEDKEEAHNLQRYIKEHQPVVFVSSYEHHSNEIMWRHTLCDVVEIPLNEEGYLDLEVLERLLVDKKYKDRDKIGSFSAASNVTGIRTPVYKVARILHKHGAIACFDFAACAPYVEINMNKDEQSYFDAIFLSPHKFLGGPGSSGLLIFNEKIYHKELPPTISAGGTVMFVNFKKELFSENIEEREKPGTPGILQNIKASLAFDLKEKVGVETISQIERFYLKRFQQAFQDHEKMIFYGPQNPDKKINIIPFNIQHKDRWLHPKFVTRLLNDLFGIQTRAGCLCAGPYGHRLLDIDNKSSEKLLDLIRLKGYGGLKPGWVRINLHYTLSREELQYIIEAIKFIIDNGDKFLLLYEFDLRTGEWSYISEKSGSNAILKQDIDAIIQNRAMLKKDPHITVEDPDYESILQKADEISQKLEMPGEYISFERDVEDIINFYVCNLSDQ
ncbi:MAG: aminotransferase class V-fold PLP-dependent enzyme [Candidatus Marinimicrobia bacterium]|nr:aminotransferase class V-fold PLP-dependent enzyme [Candidatus Neomarinimicrobiota bacterium]